MKNIKQKTNYTGSQKTADVVKMEITKRYGKKEAENYNPFINCQTFKNWISNGYKVKKGEKAIKSFIFIAFRNKKGQEEKRIKRINLFYIKQVEVLA